MRVKESKGGKGGYVRNDRRTLGGVGLNVIYDDIGLTTIQLWAIKMVFYLLSH